MNDSLYWYDLETTGTDPIMDRPLQFAGIRTDLSLNEIAEPDNFLCRPGFDVIPQPEAMLVTGILMSDIAVSGVNERTFVNQVLRQFMQPQTCVVGFNNLRFDDEFVRQMLYRNFHDPYAREWRSGNSRWDVIDLFRAAYALRPDGINWPEKEAGVPSFRLEDLARENAIEHGDAHDALADVRATIEMARKLKTAQPRLYDFLFENRGKQKVVEQLYPLGKQMVVHISSMYPATRGCVSLVLPICQHPTNSNGIIVFDLNQDPKLLIDANPVELERLIFSKTEQLAEGEDRIALKTIHINRCPTIAPANTLADSDATRLGIDLDLCQEHLQRLANTAGLVEKIQEAYSSKHFPEPDDPDQQLYGGSFFNDTDKNTMTELHKVEGDELVGFRDRFQDDRLEEMVFRFQARNHPESLEPDERQQWDQYRLERWHQGDAIDEVMNKIATLKSERHDEQSNTVLVDLQRYIQSLRDDVTMSH